MRGVPVPVIEVLPTATAIRRTAAVQTQLARPSQVLQTVVAVPTKSIEATRPEAVPDSRVSPIAWISQVLATKPRLIGSPTSIGLKMSPLDVVPAERPRPLSIPLATEVRRSTTPQVESPAPSVRSVRRPEAEVPTPSSVRPLAGPDGVVPPSVAAAQT